MCHTSVMEFIIEEARIEEFKGKRVLEIGSRYINESVRPFIEKYLKPKEYIGIDIEKGKFVDIIFPAEKLLITSVRNLLMQQFLQKTLEHVRNWRVVIENIKKVIKKKGYLYITTRSKGFPYHDFPFDFWRYEIEDMKIIFSDFEIIKLKKDPQFPGVFLKARKPSNFIQKDLTDIPLYSMILGKKTKIIPDKEKMPTLRKLILSVNTFLINFNKRLNKYFTLK